MDYKGIHLPDRNEPKEPGKLIGMGATADVYEWGTDKVIKLFHSGYPVEAITREYYNALAVKHFTFAKAVAYELKTLPNGFGIVYSRLQGESLLDYVMRTGDVIGTANYLVDLHQQILSCQLAGETTKVKDFLHECILNSKQAESSASKEMLRLVDLLPDGQTLCHGDFHPGNVIITEQGPAVLDFMNVCRGDALYDIARTLFLICYTPVPVETKDVEQVEEVKKELGLAYLSGMGKTMGDIGRYLSMIIAARSGEIGE